MSEFLAFVLIVFTAVWGSVFLGIYAKRYLNRVEADAPDSLPKGVREDMLLMEARLDRVEEELSFYRELNKGDSRTLSASDEEGPER